MNPKVNHKVTAQEIIAEQLALNRYEGLAILAAGRIMEALRTAGWDLIHRATPQEAGRLDLAACPFCGDDDIYRFPTLREGHRIAQCQGCGAQTPLPAWNRRAPTESPAPGVDLRALLEDATRRGFNMGMAYIAQRHTPEWGDKMIESIPRWVMEDSKGERSEPTDPTIKESLTVAPTWTREKPTREGAGRFRKRPVVIDAFRMGIDPRPDWFTEKVIRNEIVTMNVDGETREGPFDFCKTRCEIKTLEGVMKGDYGDWIIRGVKGECYPCKPDIFAMTYERAEGPEA